MSQSLSQYVQRVMEERREKPNDVVGRSSALSHGALADIVQERTVNPTINTLQALAIGLVRPVHELVNAALGIEVKVADAKRDRFLWMYESLPPVWQEEELARLEFVSKRHGVVAPKEEVKNLKVKPAGMPPKQRIPVVKPKDWAPEKLKKQKTVKVHDE